METWHAIIGKKQSVMPPIPARETPHMFTKLGNPNQPAATPGAVAHHVDNARAKKRNTMCRTRWCRVALVNSLTISTMARSSWTRHNGKTAEAAEQAPRVRRVRCCFSLCANMTTSLVAHGQKHYARQTSIWPLLCPKLVIHPRVMVHPVLHYTEHFFTFSFFNLSNVVVV